MFKSLLKETIMKPCESVSTVASRRSFVPPNFKSETDATSEVKTPDFQPTESSEKQESNFE